MAPTTQRSLTALSAIAPKSRGLALPAGFSQALAVASDDHQEGVAAFFDKRPPKFNGT